MEAHHNAFVAPRRVAHDGLEVLTHWEQPHPTGYASQVSTSDWGAKLSSPASPSRSSSWDSDTQLRSSGNLNAAQDSPNPSPHRWQQSTASCSSGSGDKSPVAALGERVRKIQGDLALLDKDLRELEQAGYSCQRDPALHHSTQEQVRRCSWCRTKTLWRGISTKAKKALGIPRKQDKAPSELPAAWDPSQFDTSEPQLPPYSTCPTGELPGTDRMFELEHAEIRWELGEANIPTANSEASLVDSCTKQPHFALAQTLQVGPQHPEFSGHSTEYYITSPYSTHVSSSTSSSAGSFPTPGSSFSDIPSGMLARPSRFSHGSSISTSSSSFRGSHSWVTPQSSLSVTSSTPLLNSTVPGVSIGEANLCESPTTLEPEAGMNNSQDLPPWGRNQAGPWCSTSTMASGSVDPFSDPRWKTNQIGSGTSSSGGRFWNSHKGEQDETGFHLTAFQTSSVPLSSRQCSSDKKIFELPCPSTSPAFQPSAAEARVQTHWSNEEDSPCSTILSSSKHPRRTTYRADNGHSASGPSLLTTLEPSPPTRPLVSFPQALMDLDRSLESPLQYHLAHQLSDREAQLVYDAPLEYSSMTDDGLQRPMQVHGNVFPHSDPHPHIGIGPRQDAERNLQCPRQASLLGIGCKPCRYFPQAPDQRKKMERHKKCDRHRRRMNQGIERRMLCPALNPDGTGLCGKRFGRRDNLGQHVKKDHGMELKECGQVRYELGDDDEAEMWDS